jgi:hypothetical protein
MKQTYEEAVIKTVLWWMEKSFHTPLNQNNGDDSASGAMTLCFMNEASRKAQNEITPSQENKFEEKLTELLFKAHEDHVDIELSVDYVPCNMLMYAATSAGIDIHCFPCKSSTYINKENQVFAKWKYGSQHIEI